MPAPVPAERAAYRRATTREMADWPLVEAAVRLTFDGDTIATAAVAAGGVARTPLLLPEVGDALLGGPADARTASGAPA
ncbi:hypothetical protein [Actinomadura sp. KC345]|uniref:hypothetical protein n=1 Tax=Actinomadura sp. KC345 TaxID=2530371 RepID=UPI0014052DDF